MAISLFSTSHFKSSELLRNVTSPPVKSGNFSQVNFFSTHISEGQAQKVCAAPHHVHQEQAVPSPLAERDQGINSTSFSPSQKTGSTLAQYH